MDTNPIKIIYKKSKLTYLWTQKITICEWPKTKIQSVWKKWKYFQNKYTKSVEKKLEIGKNWNLQIGENIKTKLQKLVEKKLKKNNFPKYIKNCSIKLRT